MAVALLDTNVLFASASSRDEYHDRAREIVRGIDHGNVNRSAGKRIHRAAELKRPREHVLRRDRMGQIHHWGLRRDPGNHALHLANVRVHDIKVCQ